jgi:hypothetical protein
LKPSWNRNGTDRAGRHGARSKGLAVIDLLYISGSGRSGSTMLERVLHAAPRFQALGEFHCLWRLPADEITCSCGEAFAGDDFWQAVLAEAGIGAADLAELARVEAKVARSGFLAGHGFRLDRVGADPDVRAFLAPQFAIFAALRKLAGRPVVVDSSKAGPRAWLLATDPRVGIVHLWRNPEDVIASWRSRKFDAGLGRDMDRPSVGHAAADWWKVEHLMRRLARERPVAMVDYAALCRDPRAQVEAALAAAGLAGPAGIPWRNDRSVEPGAHYHSLNGNPDRFGRELIEIRERRPDPARTDRADRVASQLVGGLLRSVYRPVA